MTPTTPGATPPTTLLQRLKSRLGLGHDWYVVIVAAAIGLIMSGIAMAFILPIRWMQRQPGILAEHHPYLLLLLIPVVPVVGALLTGLVHNFFPSESSGRGVPAVMYAIHRRQARLPLKLAFSKWIASTCTIASGGSAGPEGPIVTIGAAIGSWLSRVLRVHPTTAGTFLGCAAAAGMGSVFNAPIAGIFFVLEVLLRDFSLRTFTPIVIAAVASSAATQAVLGDTPLFGVGPEFFASPNRTFTLTQLPNYLVMAVACGVLATLFIRGMGFAERQFARLPVAALLRPAVGALFLGVLGLVFTGLAMTTSIGAIEPVFFGDGYAPIKHMLDQNTYLDQATGQPLPVLVVALVLLAICGLKFLATWFTLGSGGSGGLFAPALFLGAAFGGAFGCLVSATGLAPAAQPAQYALVGMAAMVAATSHAPLTAILIVYEITRSYEGLLPIMLASVIATLVARLIFPESVYTAKLAAMGVRVGGTSDLPLLRRLTASDVPLLNAIVVHPDESGERLLELTEQTGVGDFVVLDPEERYAGMVTGVDLRKILLYREAVPLLQINEIMRTDLPTVDADETLDLVLEKFNASDVHCLVVLSERGDGTVRGVIARSRVLRRYQESLHEG
ncbi:MAG: chloride channel protein [Phycisphaerales bacterium]|nr:chloride channel protein [Phycisphaerales bacterium]